MTTVVSRPLTSFPGSFLYFLEVERGPWERGCDNHFLLHKHYGLCPVFRNIILKAPGSFEALFTRCPADVISVKLFIAVTARSVFFTSCKARMEFFHALLRKDLWSLYLHV